MTPLFEKSLFGSSLVVWPSHIEYKAGLLNGKITIPTKDISSVEEVVSLVALSGLRELKVETSGGKTFKILVSSKDRDAAVQAMLKAKSGM